MLASDIGWSEKKVNASDMVKMPASDIGWSDRKVIAFNMVKMHTRDIGFIWQEKQNLNPTCCFIVLPRSRKL